MFDFRYHALSLSAVIVALVLGVLLGVAIGDHGLVSSAEKGLRQSLRHDISSAQSRADDLQGELNDRDDVLARVYPLLVGNHLANSQLGIIYLGEKSNAEKDLIVAATKPAGAHLAWLLAIHEPLDGTALASHAAGTQYAGLATDPSLYTAFGVRIGTQLATGGKLVGNERKTLAGSFDGTLTPVQTVVIVHDPPPHQTSADKAFEKGLVTGLAQGGATVVGVQTTKTTPSQTGWFRDQGMTYVSDIDQIQGQLALIYGLTGQGSGELKLSDVTSGG